MALIHREASEEFPEKSAGRAAFNSDLVDIAGVVGGAEVAEEAVGATGMGVLGLGGRTVGLGLLGAFWGLLGVRGLVTGGMMGLGLIRVSEGSMEILVDSLRGLSWMLGVGAQGGESILMSVGSSLPNARENSPFRLLVMAKVGSYT